MFSELKQAVMHRDMDRAGECLDSLEQEGEFSLPGIVETLVPVALMECNLPHRNFHQIKMSLMFRRLSLEGILSGETEKQAAHLICSELIQREWADISAGFIGYMRPEQVTVQDMAEEIERGNAHNAFYYAAGCVNNMADPMIQALLMHGAHAVPETLGHSFSCFLQVMEDIVRTGHSAQASALLSYVMYLCRFSYPDDLLQAEEEAEKIPADFSRFIMYCASGDGIVNLHHTITLYLFMQWEKAEFNEETVVPYGILADWAGEKAFDTDRKDRVSPPAPPRIDPADTYTEFEQEFSFDDLERSMLYLFANLEAQPDKAADFIFRLYTSRYGSLSGWDPHYITGLYSALGLFLNHETGDPAAPRMALDQAVRYFASADWSAD